MAIKSQAQIQAESNSTYVDNTVGSITPANVRTLNTNWIDSIIYVEQTASLSVLSASFATNSATASFLIGSIASASFATQAATASLALTASTTPNALVTASAVANILTFTKGNGTTFNVTVAQSGSVASASYADTANFANTAALATTASFAISASRAISAATATNATTATSALTSISASFATFAATAGTIAGGATLSGNNVFTGVNTFNNSVTMSNVQVNGTASIAFLNVVFQSSSVIYSSGSNQFGDASNDTQTLYGTVNVITGPLVVTGSANFKETITGSVSNAINATNASTASFVANAFISASQVGGNDKVSLTNASGTTTTLTINNVASATNAGSANTAISASFATVAGTAVNAQTASYSTNFLVSGSLVVTGSATISTGSLILYSYKVATPSNRSFEGSVTQSADSTNNIISIVSTSAATTGSIVISGSGNYISLSGTQGNTTNANGTTSGFNGTNAYLTALPQTSGSNPNFNTAADRNNRRVPAINNSNVNSIITVNDNRASETSTPLTISNSSVNSTFTANIGSGSLGINNSNIVGSVNQFFVSNSFGGNANTALSNSFIFGSATAITTQASGSRSAAINNSIIGGNAVRLLVSASGAIAPTLASNLIVGDNLIVTSSYYASGFASIPVGSAFLGSFNVADGILNSPEHTRFALGTGASEATRRTSLSVSSSGLTTISDGLRVTGSLNASNITGSLYGTASWSQNSLTASYFNGLVASASYAVFAETAANANTANVANSALSATSASYALSSSFATTAATASFVSGYATLFSNTFNGDQTIVTGNNLATDNITNSSSSLTIYVAGANSLIITGSTVLTGSLVGQPVSQSVSSLTASLDLRAGNFFNLTLPDSVNTYITASGQVDGQTINLKITQQTTTGSVSFGAGIKQASGSAYVATALSGAVDIVTFISFDNTGLYVSNVNNLI